MPKTTIAGTIRAIRWIDTENPPALAEAIKAASAQRYFSADEAEWQIGAVYHPRQGVGLKSSVYLPVIIKGLFEEAPDTEPEEKEFPAFERVAFYYVPEAGSLFFVQPTLNSRSIGPSAAIDQATQYLLIAVKAFGAPISEFSKIRTERTKEWFINRLLEVARSTSETLEKVTVQKLDGAEIPDEFQIYNPDPDGDAIARRFLRDGFNNANTLTMTATAGEDLSHNPLTRAAMAAGEPASIRISKPSPTDREPERVTYPKKQTGQQFIRSDSPDTDSVLDALATTLIRLALEPS
jgi:hypothetical protein